MGTSNNLPCIWTVPAWLSMSTQFDKFSNLAQHPVSVTRASREARNGHRGVIVWFTGLSGSGKSTLAYLVEASLHGKRCQTVVLDGDHVRNGLCCDLGFTLRDREENIRRVGEVAKLFMEVGTIVLAAFISPLRGDRARVRGMVEPEDFLEVYCNASLDVCESRDPKGLYKRARIGEIADFTGITSPYEPPLHPDLVVESGTAGIAVCVHQIVEAIDRRGICQFPLSVQV